MPIRPIRVLCATVLFAVAAVSQAQVSFWHNVGQIGGPVFWVAGLGSSFVQDGSLGLDHAARTFDGMLAAGGVTELLQVTTRERDPYGNGHGAFPSMHTSLSFAVAAAQSNYHPSQAPLWYGAASVIGVARVLGHDHFIQDVVVGAGLGYAAGQLSVSSRHGWFFAPMVEHGRAGFALGVNQSF